jgi:ribA/ribD-fused uncharacterized protein
MKNNTFFFFWGGPLSQWFKSPFTRDGTVYATAEQYMMAMKAQYFGDSDALRKIMATSVPKEQKAIGRTVKNFDPQKWTEVCRDFVLKGNLAKFKDPHLRSILLATGDLELVEASPYDKIWGIGLAAADPRALNKSQWLGTNWLGMTLMKVREAIKDEHL